MTVKTWKAWGSLEERRLRELRREGHTLADIAWLLGRTIASVRSALTIAKVKKPNHRRERWLRVLAKGYPIRETAYLMGTTLNAVKQMARRLRRAGYEVPKVRKRRQR